MIKPLDWDSNFFGINTGRLDAVNKPDEDIRKIPEVAKGSGFRLIYIFAPHDNEKLSGEILKTGAVLADEKVTFSMNVAEFAPSISENVVSCLGSEMDDELESLAIESGKYSRFQTDERIPRKKFEDLYRLWMKNSLSGNFAKQVYAYEEEGKRLGMVSIDIRQGEGWIGIIAVNENYRGRSIGKLLIHKVIQFCRENKVNVLNVQTQLANQVSCAFYEKTGFSVKNIEDVYHLWNE